MSSADTIKAAIKLANDSYDEGRKHGYQTGFREGLTAGLDAAKKLLDGASPEQIVAELAK